MQHFLSRLQGQMVSNWDRPALCDYQGDSFTFGDLAEHIARIHIFFRQLGIKKGDKISICGKNQARWGISFFATISYEAVAVPILDNFHIDNISNIVNLSESLILIADPEIWNKLEGISLPTVRLVVSMRDFTPLKCSEEDKSIFSNLDNLFQETYPNGFCSADVEYPTDNDKDLCIINYTSGSTGSPKGVMLRYECISANTEFAQNHIPSYAGDHVLSVLPMAHMFGMAFEMVYPLCGGSTIHFLGKLPSPSLLMKALADVRPYIFIAVPMVYEKIYQNKLKPVMRRPLMKLLTALPGIRQIIFKKMRQGLDDAFGGKVRIYIMGGAALNPEAEDFFHRIGWHFTVGYGMTEAAPLLSYVKWDKFVLRSCGKAMDYMELRIDSSDPEHVPGEIQARGINLFTGYYKNEEATQSSFTEDGWFHTGDLGVIDREGNVFIRGRLKSMLLSSNGQNIYPEEIECVLNSMKYVMESLVVMREDKLVALIALDEEAVAKSGLPQEAVTKKIRKDVNLKLDKYSQIAEIEVMREPFEKTPKMSIKRFLYS